MGPGNGTDRVDPPTRMLSPDREAVFPNLASDGYRVTSDEDWGYNCIAHAAERNNAPWWPTEEPVEGVFWPDGVPREETLEAFTLAYETLGYFRCENANHEPGFQKVAIYIDEDGAPSHAAIEDVSGGWSSKLGDWEDIRHNTLAALEACPNAPAYGTVVRYLKRPSRSPAPLLPSAVQQTPPPVQS
jgi:hypothetical protein